MYKTCKVIIHRIFICFTGRVAEALIYYKRAMAVNMEHRESVLGLAKILRGRGQKSRVYRLITW